jgi:hypothetical protein
MRQPRKLELPTYPFQWQRFLEGMGSFAGFMRMVRHDS